VAPSDPKPGKHRVQIKVTDVDSGEERYSTDIVVGPGRFCSYCCTSSSCVPVIDGPVDRNF
jgi:hypothetical protein